MILEVQENSVFNIVVPSDMPDKMKIKDSNHNPGVLLGTPFRVAYFDKYAFLVK
ncbi:hypothetical protein WMQ45_16200 [Vibrio diabolicus]|uniref:hypothetical protein n=1 Tax=Vibrio diabolicus TaxID=50719 RepID=UPI003753231A